MELYDIIVVGAGPAGLVAAKEAAEANAHVLLIEKNEQFGKKACGEGVSKATIAAAGLSPDHSFISNQISSAFVYPPDEKKRVEIRSKEPDGVQGYIIEKSVFLRTLAEKAESKGVEIQTATKVIDLSRDSEYVKVAVEKKGTVAEFRSKMVIGCDGLGSVVGKKFFKRRNVELIPCIQYKLDDCNLENEHATEFYLGRVAPLGYAWVFPKKGGLANVGIGARGVPVKVYLDKFIQAHPEKFGNSRILKVEAAPVPISGQVEEIVADNAMICGDAAGQVIPFTGGGIHSSIAAGKIAGEVAAKAVQEKNVSKAKLAEYPNRYETYWVKRIRNSLKALRAIEKLSDEELNQLADILSGEDVVDLASGLNTERVAKILLKHPLFAIKIAKVLLG